jgi:diacylglycerol kinase (ATP)
VNIGFVIHPGLPEAMETLRHEVVRLREEGHDVLVRLTFESGDAEAFAREMCEDRELVFSVGGDGTLNEVVNGIHQGGEGAERPLPAVAVVPLGTGNDLARAIGMPPRVAEAVRAAMEGERVEVDVGLVNDRCFLNVSSGGLGAEATDETSAEAKRALGRFAYLVTGVRKFVALHPTRGHFRTDGPLYEGPFLIFAIGNSRLTGAGNRLTPRASLVDGRLDLCIVLEMPRVDLLGLLPALRSGEHLDHPRVLYTQVRRLEIEAEAEMGVNADGEPMRGRRFVYSVSPRRLPLMVPAEPVGDAEPRQELLGMEGSDESKGGRRRRKARTGSVQEE